MKNQSILIPLLALVLCISLSMLSCDDSDPPDSIFTWNFDGVHDTSTLYFASLHNMGTAGESKIIAGNGYTIYYKDRVCISLPSLSIGSFALGVDTMHKLTYFDDLEFLLAMSGTVNITEHKDKYISGNFSATLVNSQGTNKSLTGNFLNVEIFP